MDWWRVAVVFLLAVAAEAQRGSRRYVPDQPVEESLSVENHRFKSQSRDEVRDTQRGVGYRVTTQASLEQHQRLNPTLRSRGRSEEVRQFHSTSGRPEQQNDERPSSTRQFHSRRNQEPERTKFTSNTNGGEIQSQRFKSRDSTDVTERSLSRNQNSGRSRSRGEVKESHDSRRGSSARRLPSRTAPDTDTQSANLEPVRNRVGSRGRTINSNRNTTPKSKSLPEAEPSIPEGIPVISTENTISRADLGQEELNSETLQPLEKLQEISASAIDSSDLSAKINDLPDNNEELNLEKAEKGIKQNDEPIKEKLFENLSDEYTKSTSSNLPATPSENIIDFPSKLNDVEESNRASRRLDFDITPSSQFSRSRSRDSDETSHRRIAEVSKKSRGENIDKTSSRRRNGEIRSRIRASEEQNEAKSRTVNDPARSSRVGIQGKEENIRGRNSGVSRNTSEFPRNSRVESSLRPRGGADEDSPRSRTSEINGRQRNSAGIIERNRDPKQGKISSELQGTTRNLDGRSRRPSTESFSTGEVKRRPEKYVATSRERPLDFPKRDALGVRSSHRYSAKIPASPTQNEEEKSSVSLSSKGRSKDLSNFRSRSKLNEGTALSEGKSSDSILSVSPGKQNIQKSLTFKENNEVTSPLPSEETKAPTAKSLESLLHRKLPTNRPRGPAKGPKLKEETESGEVRDDDNYPEVYKQLKKSGTSPKEILELLKARKAAQEKLDYSKAKFTQPDASLKTSHRELKPNEEFATTQEKNDRRTHSLPRFRSRNQETESNSYQKRKSKSDSSNFEAETPEKLKEVTTKYQSRRRLGNSRLRSELNQREDRTYKKIEELNSEKSKEEREKSKEEREKSKEEREKSKEEGEKSKEGEEKSKDRRYSSVKSFDYKPFNKKRVSSLSSTEPSRRLTSSSHLLKKNIDDKVDDNKLEENYDYAEDKVLNDKQNRNSKENSRARSIERPTSKFSSEVPTAEDQTKTYTPRNRQKEYARFKARTEKTVDFVTEETPIRPNYKLYNRNDGSTFRRSSFTTPTAEAEDETEKKQFKNSLTPPRNRPTYVPPKRTYTRQTTTPLPLSRYRERKASLTKFINQEDLKVDNSEDHKLIFNSEVDDQEDLRSRFNGLSIDSLVSESEHASFTTEPNTVSPRTTRKRTKYSESFIQRIPPRGKAVYTRPTFRPSATTERSTTSTSIPESTTLAFSSLTISEFSDGTESDFISTISSFIPTVEPAEDEFTSSIITNEATTLETTTAAPTTTTTTTTMKPLATTKKKTITQRPTKHTSQKPKITKPTTKKLTTTTTRPTTTTTKPTTTTTRPTTTTTRPTTTTTRPTTTTARPTTTTTKPTTTTTRPTTTTTRQTTTTTRPTTTTTRPTTTTTRPTTTTTKPTTTTTIPTTTTTVYTTTTALPTTTVLPTLPTTLSTTLSTTTTTKKMTTITFKTTTKKAKATTTTRKPSTKRVTKPTTTLPSTTKKITQSTTTTTPVLKFTTIDSLISTKQPNFLSTIAYLAQNLSVTPTDYKPINTADFRTTSRPTVSTTAMNSGDNYVVYGLLPNNNVVRKVIKTTKSPIDLPFIIYGLYPNGTIVRRFPNGTIIPEETEEENEVIGRVDPESHEELENVVKKDNPLSYLYPPGSQLPSTSLPQSTKSMLSSTYSTPSTEKETTPISEKSTTLKNEIMSLTTSNKHSTLTTGLSTMKPTVATNKKAIPKTTKGKQSTTTTKRPTTTRRKSTTIAGTTTSSTTTRKPKTTTTRQPKASTTTSTTKKTTTATKKPTVVTTTKKPIVVTTTKKPTSNGTKKPATTTKPSTTTPKSISTTLKVTSKLAVSQHTTKPTSNPKSKTIANKATTSIPIRTQETKKSNSLTSRPITTTKITDQKKQTPSIKNGISSSTPKSSITSQSKPKISTKATTPLSDIEILSNLLNQGATGSVLTGRTESSEDLANKVIQLAIERAQKSTLDPETKEVSTSDLQTLSSTTSPVVKEIDGGINVGEEKNKTGKISVWVIPPDESTTTKALDKPISQSDEAILNSLLSTPSALENLSLSDQLLLADVLSSTAFPQTTTKKKKKKRPKTTTTTQSPFPVLQYIFGRNRGGGGLFQRGLFRGGGLGGLGLLQAGSNPQVQENPGGIFQNEYNGQPQGQSEVIDEPQQQESPQEGTRLVNAAINVSRAVSQFMGFVIQGAAQSFQNYLQTRTKALTEALTYPPASN